MCGIVGIVSKEAPICPCTVERMRETMRHRGPDDRGAWCSESKHIALGHCRLSVIDLSAAAGQPMVSASGRTRAIFNGEIYNYRELRAELEARGHTFRTASDTEVLIQAYERWGLDCLPRLNGMFAFAIVDEAARQVLIARDRAGEKPLFYAKTDGLFAFASELKALFANPAFSRRLDHEALEHYFAYGYVPRDLCLVQGVRKLPPGHGLLYDLTTHTQRIWPYWRLPEIPLARERLDEADLLRQLEHLLLDSVRLRLIADVPIGIMLSGGIDSSVVTALASRVAGRTVKTFTVAFPGHHAYDEAHFARQVARHCATEHVEFVAEPASVDLLPQLARQYDEPIADSSMVPTYLISKLIRREATVALGGDGGDELFGGYPHYSWLQSQMRIRSTLPAPVRSAIGSLGQALPLGFKGRNFLVGMGLDNADSVAQFNLYFDEAARRRLLRRQPARANGFRRPESLKTALCHAGASPLRQATAVDFQTYLPDDILVKVDRASMLASLEVRAPFLDPRIVEFAFQLPDSMRATAGQRKVLLRRLAKTLLPPTLDLTRKQGFSLPLDSWFKGEWGRFVQDVLSEADSDLFDRRAIRDLIAAQRRGLGNTQRLFALTMFELWRREYHVEVG